MSPFFRLSEETQMAPATETVTATLRDRFGNSPPALETLFGDQSFCACEFQGPQTLRVHREISPSGDCLCNGTLTVSGQYSVSVMVDRQSLPPNSSADATAVVEAGTYLQKKTQKLKSTITITEDCCLCSCFILTICFCKSLECECCLYVTLFFLFFFLCALRLGSFNYGLRYSRDTGSFIRVFYGVFFSAVRQWHWIGSDEE